MDVAPLTGSPKISPLECLARQTGLEPPTFWLTATTYSRCDLARRERVRREFVVLNSASRSICGPSDSGAKARPFSSSRCRASSRVPIADGPQMGPRCPPSERTWNEIRAGKRGGHRALASFRARRAVACADVRRGP